jgi:hypothetical protein
VLERLRGFLSGFHVDVDLATDLFTAVTSGLIDQQMANDPGGERWKRLLPQVIDMYADHLNLPGPRLQEKP